MLVAQQYLDNELVATFGPLVMACNVFIGLFGLKARGHSLLITDSQKVS